MWPSASAKESSAWRYERGVQDVLAKCNDVGISDTECDEDVLPGGVRTRAEGN